jgi:thiamine-phosphate pyrophosphorylase
VPTPTLIFVTDVERFGWDRTLASATNMCQVARPGSVSLQLRDKQLTGRLRLQLALELRRVASDFGQFLVVNDRLDLAALSQADGVHLGEASLDPLVVRALYPNWWISCAWHSGAPRLGADAYLVSPVVLPRKGAPALGLEGLEQQIHAFPELSIYALGGVDAVSAPLCMNAGARGVAVVGAAYTNGSALVEALGLAAPAE